MLEIAKVKWRNFLSYGDYVTEVDFTNLGQCLITGNVVDDDTKEVYDSGNPIQVDKSNGAGKSTISTALQWCLFGRTMHSPNPGDKVINWFTGQDCWVETEFKSGDTIRRTRGTDGKNELIYEKSGERHRFVQDTLATSKIQQASLAKEFGLDWDLICGSVFFNQYGKPWMEMADQQRKKAIERLLHIDRFSYYAKVAKEKLDAVESKISKDRQTITSRQLEIGRLDEEMVRLAEAAKNFVSNQKNRQRQFLQRAIEEKQARDQIELPDLTKLQERWDVVAKIQAKITEYRQKSNALGTKIAEKVGTLESKNERIATWESKAGRVCTRCEQDVPKSHVSTKIDPIKAEVDSLTTEIMGLRAERTTIDKSIKTAEQLLEQKKPEMSIRDAKDIHREYERHTEEIARLKQEAANVSFENNPHEKSLEKSQARKVQVIQDIADLEKKIEQDDFRVKHYGYVYRAYNDRAKIKSYVAQDHIPYINGRLKHYLDVFGLDVQIELTNSLSIQSNLWGYDFESGGERKRTDVAFMLAMFDFHEHMYGRQCNVMILDEVDGRLDEDGIDALINVIKNDLGPKVEALLIISHRGQMYDVFSREIRVQRTNRLSQLRMM